MTSLQGRPHPVPPHEYIQTLPHLTAYAAAVRLLAATLHGVPEPVLLDVGTGTAQVPRALLSIVPRLAHVDLVDVNQGMLAQAMADLKAALGACTVSAYAGEAHTFTPQVPGRGPDLITCCRAFHWEESVFTVLLARRPGSSS
ncbi:class I SAM-dependent methyltransferase [Streptomyces scopuliridis]|uniref:Class I SAM-dependent methyltransferase n=1 Tax=Streptomyces scopuliridis TaxID=452529 RepID=A0ACD4ZT54_9ACTN|nr:class I SAM-dependent methyltransferase [Streptomyces scopuliridis]WSC01688.1 class I SAM-dependent methyltransferase [Streptomyces scopuliridis]WSC04773.1 class I SAM-dependent methyltransferase [Streptomyces scopuliridis]